MVSILAHLSHPLSFPLFSVLDSNILSDLDRLVLLSSRPRVLL